MPPPGRHPGRSGRTAHGSVAYGSAWQPRRARAGVVVLCPLGRWDSRPCPRTYPQIRARPKQGPLAPAAFTTFVATMGPSDSLSTRRDFTSPLIPAAFARRGPSRRVSPVPHQAVPTCPSSVPRECPAPLRDSLSAVCCLRPDMTGSATPPFGFLSHEAAKFTLLALGPQVRSPRPKPLDSGRAFDAPLKRRRLRRRPEPATRRSGAYRGGTSTR